MQNAMYSDGLPVVSVIFFDMYARVVLHETYRWALANDVRLLTKKTNGSSNARW